MKPIWVCLEGERYGEAYLALRRARRAWHRLDAALVDVRDSNSDLRKAWDAVAALDQQLDRLGVLLVGEGSPENHASST